MKNFYRQNKTGVIVLGEDLWNKIIDHYNLDLSGMKLNLGCGPDYREGWLNLDGDNSVRADQYCDLDSPDLELPYQNETFDLILASHILEHIFYLPHLKKELTRTLKIGGKLVCVVPEATSPDAWGDDTHCRAFQTNSMSDTFWPNLELKGVMQVNVSHQFDNTIGQYLWLVGGFERTL